MTVVHSKIPVPISADEFETVSVKYVKFAFNSRADKYGRSGQKQHGVDIFYTDIDTELDIIFQCKNYDELTASVIESELAKTKSYPRNFNDYYFLTTIKRCNKLQDFTRELSKKENKNIYIIFWDGIYSKLRESPRIFNSLFPEYAINIPVYEAIKTDTTITNVCNLIDWNNIGYYLDSAPNVVNQHLFESLEQIQIYKGSKSFKIKNQRLLHAFNELIGLWEAIVDNDFDEVGNYSFYCEMKSWYINKKYVTKDNYIKLEYGYTLLNKEFDKFISVIGKEAPELDLSLCGVNAQKYYMQFDG